jgi:hypothetical protein
MSQRAGSPAVLLLFIRWSIIVAMMLGRETRHDALPR